MPATSLKGGVEGPPENSSSFLSIAQGSTYEVHTQLLLAKRLKIGDEEQNRKAEALCIETSKMLGAFIASLGKKS